VKKKVDALSLFFFSLYLSLSLFISLSLMAGLVDFPQNLVGE